MLPLKNIINYRSGYIYYILSYSESIEMTHKLRTIIKFTFYIRNLVTAIIYNQYSQYTLYKKLSLKLYYRFKHM